MGKTLSILAETSFSILFSFCSRRFYRFQMSSNLNQLSFPLKLIEFKFSSFVYLEMGKSKMDKA